jgi:hypothetical protein
MLLIKKKNDFKDNFAKMMKQNILSYCYFNFPFKHETKTQYLQVYKGKNIK